MSDYYFPSLLYIKENLIKVFDSIYKQEPYDYDFIVYSEAERIMKSKDYISSRSLITLVQNESLKYFQETRRNHKHDPKFVNFNVEENANKLKIIFFEKVSN